MVIRLVPIWVRYTVNTQDHNISYFRGFKGKWSRFGKKVKYWLICIVRSQFSRTRMRTCVHAYACTCIRVCVYTYVCVCTHMHVREGITRLTALSSHSDKEAITTVRTFSDSFRLRSNTTSYYPIHVHSVFKALLARLI